jgi:hypothetical protein
MVYYLHETRRLPAYKLLLLHMRCAFYPMLTPPHLCVLVHVLCTYELWKTILNPELLYESYIDVI